MVDVLLTCWFSFWPIGDIKVSVVAVRFPAEKWRTLWALGVLNGFAGRTRYWMIYDEV